MILVLGTDEAMVEGLVQALAATGQPVTVARSIDEAVECAVAHRPLLVIVDRVRIDESGADDLLRLPLASGGAVVAYRVHSEKGAATLLPPLLARLLLADVELPLERHRLVALAQHVVSRARVTSRAALETPPDSPAS